MSAARFKVSKAGPESEGEDTAVWQKAVNLSSDVHVRIIEACKWFFCPRENVRLSLCAATHSFEKDLLSSSVFFFVRYEYMNLILDRLFVSVTTGNVSIFLFELSAQIIKFWGTFWSLSSAPAEYSATEGLLKNTKGNLALYEVSEESWVYTGCKTTRVGVCSFAECCCSAFLLRQGWDSQTTKNFLASFGLGELWNRTTCGDRRRRRHDCFEASPGMNIRTVLV